MGGSLPRTDRGCVMSLLMFWTLVVAAIIANVQGLGDLGIVLLSLSIFMLGIHEIADAIRKRRA